MKKMMAMLTILFMLNAQAFGQIKPELVLPLAHTSGINIIQYSHDSKLLLSGSDDKTAKIWDIASGKLLHDLKGHQDGVISATFSKNDEFVLTVGKGFSGNDHAAKLWKTSTGEWVRNFEHEMQIHHAAFNSSGSQIVTCSEDRTVKTWDTKTGKLIFTIEPGVSSLQKVAFSNNDKLILVAAYKHISIWDAGNGKLIKKMTPKDVKDAYFFNDDKTVLSINKYEHQIDIWDAATGMLKNSLKGIGGDIKTYALSPDEKYLAVTDFYKTYVWDLASSSSYTYRVFKGGDGACFENTGTNIIIRDINEDKTKVINLSSGNITSTFKGAFTASANPFIHQMLTGLISADNQYIACFNNESIQLINYKNSSIFRQFAAHTKPVQTVAISSKGNYFAYCQGSKKVRIVDGSTGKVINAIDLPNAIFGVKNMYFTNDETKLVACASKDFQIIDVETGKLLQQFRASGKDYIRNAMYASISPDDKTLITVADDSLKAWSIETGKLMYALNGNFELGINVSFSPNGKSFALPAYKEVWVVETATGKTIQTFKNPISYFKDCSFSPDGKHIAVADDYKLAYIWNIETGKQVKQLTKHKAGLNTIHFDPSGNYIVTTSADGEAIVWDAHDVLKQSENPWKDTSAKVIASLVLEKNAYAFKVAPCFNKNWLMLNANSEIAFYDLQSMKKSFSWVGIDDEDYIIYLPNNYYTATPNAARWVNWKIGSTLYDFDQWDIKYNRPDLILKALKNTDTSLLGAYEKAYNKRLKKMGLDESMLEENYHVPEIEIVNSNIAAVSQTNKLQLKLKAKEPLKKTYLKTIYVSVNGNPVFGKAGYAITTKNKDEFVLDVTVPLTAGNNQIKVSCLNSKGAESLRKKISITYQPNAPVASRVWFVGIGVSKYKDEKYNLTYASKDINDISQLLKTKYKDYQPILLLNEQATLENIKAVNSKLQKEAKPDDIVIVSLNGHGMIDKNYNFFFGNHEINFDNPVATGLSMDDIELILDKVTASKKLILMDACHSGEIDATEIMISKASNEGDKNVKQVGRSTIKVEKKNNLKSKSSFELLQELFTSNNASSGSTIISAAGGAEYAYEGQNWNNGVFTYCLLSALKNNTADLNNDGETTISELQSKVSSQVKILTGAKQKPTSRQMNFENDWLIWKK